MSSTTTTESPLLLKGSIYKMVKVDAPGCVTDTGMATLHRRVRLVQLDSLTLLSQVHFQTFFRIRSLWASCTLNMSLLVSSGHDSGTV